MPERRTDMTHKPMYAAPVAKHSATGIMALCVAGALAACQPAWAQTTSTGATATPTSTSTTGAGTSATTSGTSTTAGSTTASTPGATSASTTTTTSTSTTGTSNSFQSGSIATFTGSGSNARTLFTSLRTGTPVALTTGTTTGAAMGSTAGSTAGSTTGSTTATTAGTGNFTSTPTTGAMGTGNVRIALALARDSLARQGITSPTPQQINAALNGGSITTGNPPRVVQLQGALALRSQGMGWGRVAQTMGVKLGPVMAASRAGRISLAGRHAEQHGERHDTGHRIVRADGRDGARHQPTPNAARITTAVGTAGTIARSERHDGHASRGIVSASGEARAPSSIRTDGTSSHGTRVALAAPSHGIVTAAGTPAVVVTSATSGALQVRADAISGGGGNTFRGDSHGVGVGGGRGR
jgi:hypothetical protein